MDTLEDLSRVDLSRRTAPLEGGPLTPDELLGLELEPGTRDVARRMLAHGASPEFARAVLSDVQRHGARGAFAVDAAAATLAALVRLMPSPRRPRRGEPAPLFAFVGPTGVGKTTSLVKLGRKLREAGRKVLFASLDPASLGALERVGSLESDVDRGEIPLAPLREPDELRRLVRRAGALDAVLLDTPGLSPREEQRLDELARELARIAGGNELCTLLVLAAGAGRGSLRLTTRAFARFRPDGCVLSKLDETDEPATAVEAMLRAHLPLAFLCDGQDARGHLVRPLPETCPDLVLRGRLA
jgi:flagellar biosynthesis protein FlhF